jgi:hypothetical protein
MLPDIARNRQSPGKAASSRSNSFSARARFSLLWSRWMILRIASPRFPVTTLRHLKRDGIAPLVMAAVERHDVERRRAPYTEPKRSTVRLVGRILLIASMIASLPPETDRRAMLLPVAGRLPLPNWMLYGWRRPPPCLQRAVCGAI